MASKRARREAQKKEVKRRRIGGTNVIERVVEKFKETYNGEYLESLPTPVIELLHTMEDNPLELNSVHKRLLHNFLNPARRYKAINFIEGPHYVSIFKTKDQLDYLKTFYIFGESHGKLLESVGQCSSLPGYSKLSTDTLVHYLAELTRNTPQFLDVYVEVDLFGAVKTFEVIDVGEDEWHNSLVVYFVEQYHTYKNLSPVTYDQFCDTHHLGTQEFDPLHVNDEKSVMEAVFRQFFNCFEPELRSTDTYQCELARFHALDIRNQASFTDTNALMFKIGALRYFLLYVNQDDNYTTMVQQKPVEQSEHEYMTRLFLKVVEALDLTRFFLTLEQTHAAGSKMLDYCVDSIPLLTKNIDKATLHPFGKKEGVSTVHPLMRQVILQFVGHALDTALPPREVLQNWSALKTAAATATTTATTFQKEFQIVSSNLEFYLFKLSSTVFDCYCLARVFRKFPPRQMDPLPHPLTPSTYIIYTGRNHSVLYTNFVNHLIATHTLTSVQPHYLQFNTDDDTNCVHVPFEYQI